MAFHMTTVFFDDFLQAVAVGQWGLLPHFDGDFTKSVSDALLQVWNVHWPRCIDLGLQKTPKEKVARCEIRGPWRPGHVQ